MILLVAPPRRTLFPLLASLVSFSTGESIEEALFSATLGPFRGSDHQSSNKGPVSLSCLSLVKLRCLRSDPLSLPSSAEVPPADFSFGSRCEQVAAHCGTVFALAFRGPPMRQSVLEGSADFSLAVPSKRRLVFLWTHAASPTAYCREAPSCPVISAWAPKNLMTFL